MSTTSIVDVPKKSGELDLFGIDRYCNGLIKFLRQSDTPITVAIQGEWGSGKTSLMNSMQNILCGTDDTNEGYKNHQHEFYGIWINTWHYSLLKRPEETLVAIVSNISTKVLQIIASRHQTVSQKAFRSVTNFVGKAFKSAASSAASAVGGDVAGNIVDALMEQEESQQTIKELRDELQAAIRTCLSNDAARKGPQKGFVIFVDDLDRIDPPVAVQILELLKNIFDLEHCIFVLAIDYDVVIKGLKPKFGELNDKNEREFRSFFDKIIQMPFSMPVASYSIDKFIMENLVKIGYIPDGKLKDSLFAQHITSICNLSVGNNPRSLKRLLNTVSLINIIGRETNDTEDSHTSEEDYALQLNFALICIQIAYPALYKVLCADSDFKKWDQTVATKHKLRVLNDFETQKLMESDEFNEEWEQILYRFCEKDTYLSNKVVQISQLFNLIAKLVPEGEDLGNTISDLLALSAVTDLQAFDKPKQAINKGPILKLLSQSLLPLLKDRLRPPFTVVRQQSKKVVSNVYLSFSKENWADCIGLSADQVKDNVGLWIWHHPWAFKYITPSMADDIKNAGFKNELDALKKSYQTFQSKYKDKLSFKYEPMDKSGFAKGWHVPHLTLFYSLRSLDDIRDPATLSEVADITSEFMNCNGLLKDLAAAYNQKLAGTQTT
jgi:hypothetical protein